MGTSSLLVGDGLGGKQAQVKIWPENPNFSELASLWLTDWLLL